MPESPVQDSPIQDWLLASFLGYDEVRAVKPLPHLGWRDRLECFLCQEDSNLLAQDRGVPDCHRRLENAVELGRTPGELNRVAESNCAREPGLSHASRRCASGSNGQSTYLLWCSEMENGWMVQKAVRSEASSPNSLGPKRDWPEVRGEVHHPRTVLSWLLAKRVVGKSEEAGRRTLEEEKEIALSLRKWRNRNKTKQRILLPVLHRGKERRCSRLLLRKSKLQHLRVTRVRAASLTSWTTWGLAWTQRVPLSCERLDALA